MKTLRQSLTLALAGSLLLPSLSFALPPLLEVSILNWNTAPLSNSGQSSSGSISRSLASTNNTNGRANSTASASFGILRARAEAIQLSHTGSINNVFPIVRGKYRDNRVTNAPGRMGQAGFVTVKFTVEGNQVLEGPHGTANQSHFSEAEYNLLVDGGTVARKVWRVYADGQPPNCGDSCAPFLNIEQTVTYGITFGTPYDFELNVKAWSELRSFPGNPGGSRVLTDLGNTATWGGIVSVTDANGNPVTDYTDTSASGANYVGPIVPQCATPSNGLVGWWPGDANTRDIEGGNDGALEDGATYGSGRVGQSFSFPTAGARVHVPQAASLDFNATQDYTIDFWMKAGPQTGTATLVEKNGGTYPYSVQLLPTGFVTAGFSDGTSPTSVTSTDTPGKVNDNLWHHVAVVFQHSTKRLELYVDGSLNASQTYTATLGPLANGQDLYFGARSDGSNSLIGLIDEVDISGSALSISEIQAIVAAADLGKCREAVVALGAVSRKTHGGTGDFDIPLPLSGTPGVECRTGGPTGDYQIVITFADAVDVTGAPQAAVNSGTGDIGSGGVANGGAVTVDGATVTIPLTNVTNAQNLVVTLLGVSNGASTTDFNIPMGVLIGDTTGNGSTTASDIAQVKASVGSAVSGATFRADVTANGGTINASDVGLTKSASGLQLPTAAPAERMAKASRR